MIPRFYDRLQVEPTHRVRDLDTTLPQQSVRMHPQHPGSVPSATAGAQDPERPQCYPRPESGCHTTITNHPPWPLATGYRMGHTPAGNAP